MTEVETPLLCGGCGNRYPEYTKFCSGCGRVLGSEDEIKRLAESVRPEITNNGGGLNNESVFSTPENFDIEKFRREWEEEIVSNQNRIPILPIEPTPREMSFQPIQIPEYCGVCGGNSELCVCDDVPKYSMEIPKEPFGSSIREARYEVEINANDTREARYTVDSIDTPETKNQMEMRLRVEERENHEASKRIWPHQGSGIKHIDIKPISKKNHKILRELAKEGKLNNNLLETIDKMPRKLPKFKPDNPRVLGSGISKKKRITLDSPFPTLEVRSGAFDRKKKPKKPEIPFHQDDPKYPPYNITELITDFWYGVWEKIKSKIKRKPKEEYAMKRFWTQAPHITRTDVKK